MSQPESAPMTPLEKLLAARRTWEKAYANGGRPLISPKFVTTSGMELPPLNWPEEPGQADEYLTKLGFPGQFPYTRGVHATMYRGKP